MRRTIVSLALAIALSVSCGSSDASVVTDEERSELIADLMERSGKPEAVAACSIDRTIEAFGRKAVFNEGEPTEEELQELTAIWDDCGLF